MTEAIVFTLPGTPAGKGRPRFRSMQLGNGATVPRAYTDDKTRAAEQSVLAAYLVAGGAKRRPHEGPVEVSITATFTAAESWPKWKRLLAACGLWPHTKKPDIDNVTKAVFDGLNGRAYIDDAQIVRLTAAKLYGEAASTRIEITFLPIPERSNTK